MRKVKIYGAGSIGNHLANASRAMGWAVDLCDIDPAALERAKTDIYPARYGQFDEEIRLFVNNEAPKGGYDLIFIGTPPDVHIKLAMDAIAEKPAAVLIEKPLCGPDLDGAQALADAAAANGVKLFTGYDHVVGRAAVDFSDRLKQGRFGDLQTLDVEFREHWAGIFAAHPWLDGPGDTYLGYWQRGGGASGEHSHAINLWQHYAHEAGAGRVATVQAMMDFVEDGKVSYDKLCLLNLTTENGLMGRVVQDVVTYPPRKWARAQGRDGFIEWQCGAKPGVDRVSEVLTDGLDATSEIAKTRPDDFIAELRHIDACLSGDIANSPISGARGLDTMMVVAAAHLSARSGKTVTIDWSKGYVPDALVTN